MNFRKRFPLMADADPAASAGGAVDPAAVVADPAADSLLKAPPVADPAGVVADEMAWLPEKYRVLDGEGKLDLNASSKKLGEGYGNLAKKLGTGEAPPAAASEYSFQMPDALKEKGLQIDEVLGSKFKELAHKHGYTQAQYQAAVEASFELVPEVLDSALKLSAQQAREQLSQVWKSPTEYDAGLNNAQRAVDAAPAAIRQDLWTRFGRDPAFLQFAAHVGSHMGEDKSVVNADGGTGGAASAVAVETLMSSEAYRNPKHPEHARVSEQVRKHHESRYGSTALM
jgi:hypothetical protein